MQSRPLILTDVASKMVPQMWNYDYVLDHCRRKKVTLNKRIRDKRLWADLAPSREVSTLRRHNCFARLGVLVDNGRAVYRRSSC